MRIASGLLKNELFMKESTKTGRVGCSEFEKCLKILYLMLDNEASQQEEQYLYGHIDNCMVCFEQYEVEKQIRLLLKTKMDQMPLPSGLAENIKEKISQLA